MTVIPQDLAQPAAPEMIHQTLQAQGITVDFLINLNFSEAIARDLEHTGVSVTCLCPGATRTDFARRADIENLRLFRLSSMDARRVAQAGYAGLMQRKTTVVPGMFNQLLALSIRFTPRRLVTRIGKYLMARPVVCCFE